MYVSVIFTMHNDGQIINIKLNKLRITTYTKRSCNMQLKILIVYYVFMLKVIQSFAICDIDEWFVKLLKRVVMNNQFICHGDKDTTSATMQFHRVCFQNAISATEWSRRSLHYLPPSRSVKAAEPV